MIARRIKAIELQVAFAVLRLEKGGDPPTFAQLQGWMRVLDETRELAEAMEATEIAIPVPPRHARRISIGMRPSLVVHDGGRL